MTGVELLDPPRSGEVRSKNGPGTDVSRARPGVSGLSRPADPVTGLPVQAFTRRGVVTLLSVYASTAVLTGVLSLAVIVGFSPRTHQTESATATPAMTVAPAATAGLSGLLEAPPADTVSSTTVSSTTSGLALKGFMALMAAMMVIPTVAGFVAAEALDAAARERSA